MPVQMIIGNNPNTKRKQTIHNLYKLLNNEPDAKVIYLVPDNVKYEAETMILKEFKMLDAESKYSGMIGLQVFSFSRLAWYLLQNKAIYQKPRLTESGLAMLVKKILQEKEEELTIYRGASQQMGFVERLVKLFSELRNGKITANDLVTLMENSSNESSIGQEEFNRKLNDLTLLYTAYDQALENSYVEKEDLYFELIEHIKNNKEMFDQTIFIVDHYEHFSAQELELLIQFAKYSKELFIHLTIDEQSINVDNQLNHLFYRTNKTYHLLKNEMLSNQVEVREDFISPDDRFKIHSEEIRTLGDFWLKSSGSILSSELKQYQIISGQNIELWAAEDNASEIMHIATKIKQMVTSGDYRYKDFQIMSRDLETYKLNIEQSFIENDIPYFIDVSETMAQHPLLEFISSLFLIKKNHYRLNDVIRFLRTELFNPLLNDSAVSNAAKEWREKVDVTENVALAYGMSGKAWYQEEDWIYARFMLDEDFKQSEADLQIQTIANEVRNAFKNKVVPFLNKLDDLQTNEELATLLYQFLVDLGVVDQLQNWRDELIEAGNLTEARKHEQVWETFISLLDEFVEILGEEEWALDLFLSIIETGFEQATFSMVPPSIDQVLVTNFDMPKIQSKKVVFLIGLTDVQLPKIPGNRSLLTDEDREIIGQSLSSEKYLAVSEMESFANESFTFYLTLLQANKRIFFTYPMRNADNNENRISPYLKRIKDAFALELQLKQATPLLTEETMDPIEFIGSESQTFSQMLVHLRHAMDTNETPSSFWLELYTILYQPSIEKHRRLMNSLYHKNLPTPLTEELAEELYGKELYLSISQLETFYADPYSHFLLYGLRLKERQIQELSPLESGNFYHDALDLISRQILQLNKDLSEITRDEKEQITRDIFNFLMDSNKYRLAQSSKRMAFIFKRLGNTVDHLIQSMIEQAKRSKYRLNKTELVFGQLGQSSTIQGLSFDLDKQRKILLRGKVDRVDTFRKDNQLYAGIVDYKSSDTSFNYQNIYYGLMMQMITYLDTVLTFSQDIFEEEARGIGAFYSTVKDKYIDLTRLGNKNIDDERLKSYKLDGLIVNQADILEAADTVLDVKEYSPVYNLYLNKDGIYSGKNILTEEEFSLLLRYNREKIVEAGNSILKGVNTLHPFNQKDIRVHTPSVTGPYRAISQFDALLPENNYRDANKIDKDTFFNYLREKYQTDEEA